MLHLLRLQGKVPREEVWWLGRDERTKVVEKVGPTESRKGIGTGRCDWRWDHVEGDNNIVEGDGNVRRNLM